MMSEEEPLNTLIQNYEGKAFVAYIDISGFKHFMEKNEGWIALDKFYNAGYRIIGLHNQRGNYRVDGIFISDCGILFSRANNQIDQRISLDTLLQIVKKLNREMLTHDYMLTTSIAFGDFRYQNRLMITGVRKEPIYGNAYVEAFTDNEHGIPKISPGECRILITDQFKDINMLNNINNFIRKKEGDEKHYYYYWMINNPDQITDFEKSYNDSYKKVFSGFLAALKGNY